ncbi:hypothetical protein [Cyanobium sp. ATX-6F1]|uniref:hypothetical protein n=1 Tax=Cyanobium sp. ATX-6F1 TaxID=3137388 RepID=UPI0039BE7DEE
MDLLDGFARNPLEPAYRSGPDGPEAGYANGPGASECATADGGWRAHPGGLVAIGHPGEEAAGFHFDNETPATATGSSPSPSADDWSATATTPPSSPTGATGARNSG